MKTRLLPAFYGVLLVICLSPVFPTNLFAENYTVGTSAELDDAISSLPIGLSSHITLTADITFTGEIYVNRGTKLTFHPAGHILTVYGFIRADMLSEIKLDDTQAGSVLNAFGGVRAGSRGSSITVTNASDPFLIAAGAYDGGTILIKGNLLDSYDTAIQCYGKDDHGNPSSVTVGGNVKSSDEGYAMVADDSGIINVHGNFQSASSGAMAGYSGLITIDGNVDCASGYGVYAYHSSTIIVNGVITAPLPIALVSSDLPPTNQSVQDGYTIYTRSGADISMVKVKIQGANQTPSVITGVPSAITVSQAAVTGEISSDGGAVVSERGFVYGLTVNPTTADTKVVAGSGTGSFNSTLIGLTENTPYHVRAYGTNSVGTAYGDDKAFTTLTSGALMVSSTTLNIAATNGSTSTFDITSNINWTVAVNGAWLIPSPASGTGNARITITAEANPLTIPRIATVTVSGTGITDKTITVTQAAGTPQESDCLSFVLTNEGDDRMIDRLVENGCTNLYQAMVYLRNHMAGNAPARLTSQLDFLITEVMNFPDGVVFTTALTHFTGAENSPVGINADGTIKLADFSIYNYDGQPGYERYTGDYLFTYSDNDDQNIFLGSSEFNLGGGVVKIVNYKAFAVAWNMVSTIKVAGSATDDTAILKIDNKTPSTMDKTWEITITTGTVKAVVSNSDLEITGLPFGFSYTAEKDAGNSIIITLTGTATYVMTNDHVVAVIVKGSAVNETGAQDSESITLNLWSIGPETTFVITNEGGLIDKLIASGQGSKNLYELLQFLKPVSGAIITDRFLKTLESTPAAGDIFHQTLGDFTGLNNPVCINIDGTLRVNAIFGNDHYNASGYTSVAMQLASIGRIQYTKANSADNYIDAGESIGQRYHAFAIAWIYELTLSINSTILTLASTDGSSGSIKVTSNTGWYAQSDQDWLTVSPESGFGNGTIMVTAEANPLTTMRTAIVSVGGLDVATQTILVRQDTHTGIEINISDPISIYPNPFTDGFHIKGLQTPATLYLYDMSGKIVGKEVLNGDAFISLGTLSRGLYFCRILSGSFEWESRIFKN
jgi:hypothetical protein